MVFRIGVSLVAGVAAPVAAAGQADLHVASYGERHRAWDLGRLCVQYKSKNQQKLIDM